LKVMPPKSHRKRKSDQMDAPPNSKSTKVKTRSTKNRDSPMEPIVQSRSRLDSDKSEELPGEMGTPREIPGEMGEVLHNDISGNLTGNDLPEEDLPGDLHEEMMDEEDFDPEDYPQPPLNGPIQSTGPFRQLLQQLSWTEPPETRQINMMSALQELSEMLSIATEDQFTGYNSGFFQGNRQKPMSGFNVGEFVRAFLKVLDGPEDANGPTPEQLKKAGIDADFPLEFLDPVTITSLGLGQNEPVNPELSVLALRCLSNLVEALPVAAQVINQYGGVAILVAKLKQVEFIELAESVLSLLDKLAADFPNALLKGGAVEAALEYIDFFSSGTQRIACGIVAQSLRGLNQMPLQEAQECLTKSDAVQVLTRLMSYGDVKLVESAIKAMTRIVEWISRGNNLTETLVSDEVFESMLNLLDAASPLPPTLYTSLIKTVQPVIRASSKYAFRLLDQRLMQVVVYTLVGNETDVVAAIHKAPSSDQVLQVVTLICEAVAPLPRTGVWFVDSEPGQSLAQLGQVKKERDLIKMFDKPGRVHFFETAKKLIPMLLELFGATVQPQLRRKCLEALARWLYFSGQLDNNQEVVGDAHHLLGAVLSSLIALSNTLDSTEMSRKADAMAFVLSSLQIVQFLLNSAPALSSVLVREGVVLEVEKAIPRLEALKGDAPKTTGRTRHLQESNYLAQRHAYVTTMTDRVPFANAIVAAETLAHQIVSVADSAAKSTTMDRLKHLSGNLDENLHELALVLAREDVTAFEVMEAGVVQGLIDFIGHDLQRIKVFMNIFMNGPGREGFVADAFKNLVKRLQTMLARVETWEVASAFNVEYGLLGNPAMQLARQLRLKVMPRQGGMPPLTVSLNAIATFTTLQDFLKSRYGEMLFVPGEAPDDEADEESDGDGDPFLALTEMLARADKLVKNVQGEDVNVVDVPVDSAKESVNQSKERKTRRKKQPKSFAEAAAHDWKLAFEVGDVQRGIFQPVKLDDSIFGAVYRLDKTLRPTGSPGVWHQTWAVRYHKVDVVEEEVLQSHDVKMSSDLPFEADLVAGVDAVSTEGKIMYLLRVLNGINTHWNNVYTLENYKSIHSAIVPEPVANPLDEEMMLEEAEQRGSSVPLRTDEIGHAGQIVTLPSAAFVNAKIVAKMGRQLDEPLIVAGKVLPKWCDAVARHFGFLVNFETRWLWLQSTSFGYGRSMQRWQLNAERQRTGEPQMGRVLRQKLRINRLRLLESMTKIVETYGTSRAMLEIEFTGEVGTGLGPTLEFYTLSCQALRSHPMWRQGSVELFPAPLVGKSKDWSKTLDLFETTGKFCAKALLDGRALDFPMNSVFLKSLLEDVPLSIHASLQEENGIAKGLHYLKFVDEELCKSLAHLTKYFDTTEVDGATVEDLALEFCLPGYPGHALPQEKRGDADVSQESVRDYIVQVIDATVGVGVIEQTRRFRAGWNQVWPYVFPGG
jgi:hypothetical protein